MLQLIGDAMSYMPQILYTKCFKSELAQHFQTLGDSGFVKKYFFENLEHLIASVNFHEEETAISVSIYAFAGSNRTLNFVDNGVWENSSPLLMAHISEA